jgi:hypothetical protein
MLKLRMRAQHLLPQSPDRVADVAQLVQKMGGIQAQDAAAARLAIGVRGNGLTLESVERAVAEQRSIVRTWGPRGTLHLLATEDIGWLLPVLGPVFIAGGQRRRAELGLDEAKCARGIAALGEILAGREPLTKAEIVEELDRHYIHMEGQASIHLLARAALEGVICLGPERGSKSTYTLLSEWVKLAKPWPEEAAYRELARRYLGAYAPATPEDMAAWSGLPMNKIRAAWQAIARVLIEVEAAGMRAWMLQEQEAWLAVQPAIGPLVKLLPAFDIYLLGYKKRDLIVYSEYTKRIKAGGGMLKPVLLVNGRARGTWKSTRKRDVLEVSVEPFEKLTSAEEQALQAEAVKLGLFLGARVIIQETI